MSTKKIHGLFVQPNVAMKVVEPMVRRALQRIRDVNAPLFPGALRNFGNWMASLVRGNAVDDRPPIWKDRPRSEVKAMLDKRVNAHAQQVLSLNARVPSFSKVWVGVEADQAKNLGPSSMYPSYLVDGDIKVRAVYSDKPLSSFHYNSKALDLALRDVANLLPKGSLRMTSMKAARPSGDPIAGRSHLDGSTNSGFPAWIRGWYQIDRKDRVHALYREWLEAEVKQFVTACVHAQRFEAVLPTYDATLGQRTVSKGPNPFIPTKAGTYKVRRFVIAMPKNETWPGKMIFSPMQEALLKVRNPDSQVRLMAGWLPLQQVDKNMQLLLAQAADSGRVVLSGDLSSFDATIPPELWWKVKLAMANWMEPDTARMFLAISYADIYRTNLLTPTKFWEAQPSSVKSGSIFTNVDDSMVNYCVQRYGYHSGYYGPPTIVVNGDDGLTDAPDLTKKGMSTSFADFGMEMNEEKIFMEPGCLHFLQRLHVLGVPGGMGSIYRVLTKCLAVEDDSQLRYDERNRFAYAVQAIARLENANFNPMFDQLVELVAEGDYRFHLGRNLPPHAVATGAGDYAVRKFTSGERNVWSPSGSGIPFTDWATNRVLRGEKLPPPGDGRWKAIYRKDFSSVEP